MNMIDLDRTLETAGLWFFLMNFELIRSWTGSKEELVEKLYRKGSDTDISGTRARVNAILRIIGAGLAEEALQKIKVSERVNHDHPGADSIAMHILSDLADEKMHPAPEAGVICLRGHGNKSLDDFIDTWKLTIMEELNILWGSPVFDIHYLPKVVLSEKTPSTWRGKDSDPETRQKLHELWDSYKKRSQLSSEENYLMDTLLNLSKGIDAALPCYMDRRTGVLKSGDAGGKALVDKIDDILFLRRTEQLTFGSYTSGTDTITLYYKNIGCDDEERFLAQLRMTLAHNMFYACHARLAGPVYRERSGEAEVVRDSLAGWFAADFCRNKDLAVSDGVDVMRSTEAASDREHAWWLYLRCDFPEAGAHYMNLDNDFNYLDDATTRKKYRKVFEIGCSDMKASYRELVPQADQRDFEVLRKGEDGSGCGGNARTTDEVWDILKGVIARHKIMTLAELNAIFPPDTIIIQEGRTLMLESGVTVSGANQIEVIDLPSLKDFAARDAFCCSEGISSDQFSELED